MATHKDEIPYFIPEGETRLIILGTMGSINARTVNGVRPERPFYYYNNMRNHFWRVLQLLFVPEKEPEKLSITQKKAFLEKWGIAMTNIVEHATIANNDIENPSDTVLFEANNKKLITFKCTGPEFRKLLQSKPMFFTCRRKKGIEELLKGFFLKNDLSENLIEHVWYWPTPTRCNPKERSLIWKKELDAFIKTTF